MKLPTGSVDGAHLTWADVALEKARMTNTGANASRIRCKRILKEDGRIMNYVSLRDFEGRPVWALAKCVTC